MKARRTLVDEIRKIAFMLKRRGAKKKSTTVRSAPARPRRARGNRTIAQALKDSEDRHALILSAVAEGIYEWTLSDNDLYVSPRLREMLGFRNGELTSESWFARVHADDKERYRGAIREHFKGRSPRLACEYRVLDKAGRYRWIQDGGIAVRDGKGRATRFVGAISDITERKRMAEALERAETRFTSALDAMSEGFTLWDADDRLVLCNRQWRSYFRGVEDRAVPGVRFEDMIRAGFERGMFPSAGADFEPWFRKVQAAHRQASGTREQHLSGDVWLRINDHRLPDGGLVSLYTDISDIRRHERELAEALERQTATSEVLGVISRSPNELQPVLDAIVETAVRLCQAEFALVWKLVGSQYRVAAFNRAKPEIVAYLSSNPINAGRGTLVGRVAIERATVHIPDVTSDPEYTLREGQRIGKFRTMLGVPLLRDGVPIGVIALHRTEVRPFADKQIELVTTFADQAVIAIENVRLFEEVQARTKELQQSLKYQTAMSEVLGVISRSPTDVQPVFEAIVKSAAELFDPCSNVHRCS